MPDLVIIGQIIRA